MAQTAAHLADRVFPDVNVRQWVLSVPKPLRLAMAMSADLCRDVARAHIRAVSASYIRRAEASEALEENAQGEPVQFHPGAVNSTQRFGSDLGLNVHFHSIYIDGVYATRNAFEPPVFLPADSLTSDEVERVHTDVIRRIRRVLVRYELDPIALGLPQLPSAKAPDDFADASDQEQPLLDFGDARDDSLFPELKAASVQSRIPCGPGIGCSLKRLIDPDLAKALEAAGWSGQRTPAPLVVNSDGFSLHAATLIRKGQRAQLEKLCRYSREPAIYPFGHPRNKSRGRLQRAESNARTRVADIGEDRSLTLVGMGDLDKRSIFMQQRRLARGCGGRNR